MNFGVPLTTMYSQYVAPAASLNFMYAQEQVPEAVRATLQHIARAEACYRDLDY